MDPREAVLLDRAIDVCADRTRGLVAGMGWDERALAVPSGIPAGVILAAQFGAGVETDRQPHPPMRAAVFPGVDCPGVVAPNGDFLSQQLCLHHVPADDFLAPR